jgi:hypothetical protein
VHGGDIRTHAVRPCRVPSGALAQCAAMPECRSSRRSTPCDPMRLKVGFFFKNPPHRALRDRRDDAASHRFVGNSPLAPLADRPIAVLRPLARHRDHCANLLGRKRRWRSRSGRYWCKRWRRATNEQPVAERLADAIHSCHQARRRIYCTMVSSILSYRSPRRAAFLLPFPLTPRTGRGFPRAARRSYASRRGTHYGCRRLGLSRRGAEKEHQQQRANRGETDDHEAVDKG